MAHAYYTIGSLEAGEEASRNFIESALFSSKTKDGEVVVLRHGLLSVEDARRVIDIALRAPSQGNTKALIITADRFFHEAQNALLKIFEEPPSGTYLFLCIPNEGVLLPTLRSRMVPLPIEVQETVSFGEVFVSGTKAKREGIVALMLSKAKSDREDEKQQARSDARTLVEYLIRKGYALYEREGGNELRAYLEDLETFLPILHERSAPLKQIFEHILIVLPKRLT